MLDRLEREEVRLHQPRRQTLPLSIYEGMWKHSPPLVAMHLLDRSCVIVGIFLKLHATFPNMNTIVLYIDLYLSTIWRLLVISVISSGTPNDIRSPNHITHIIHYRHRTLSMRTLRVRELCRHDRDTSSVNNQQQNLDAHIGSYIFYEDLYRSNRNDNIRYSLCHRYVTCPRFDRRYLHT